MAKVVKQKWLGKFPNDQICEAEMVWEASKRNGRRGFRRLWRPPAPMGLLWGLLEVRRPPIHPINMLIGPECLLST